MRIVFLSVDDEFAGLMQKYIYERHPDWVVGSVISKREIYRKNKVSAVLFILKTSGLFFFTQMFK